MGYENTRPSTLYTCDDDYSGTVRVECSGPGCVENGDDGGYCSGGHWTNHCGHTLRRWNFPAKDIDGSASYTRINGSAAALSEKCQVRCYTSGKCENSVGNASCAIGTKFCGYTLLGKGAKVDWDLFGLYKCTNGRYLEMEKFGTCRDGCNTGACLNNGVARPPQCDSVESCCCPASERDKKCVVSDCAGNECSAALSCQMEVWPDGLRYGTCLPPGAGQPYAPEDDH